MEDGPEKGSDSEKSNSQLSALMLDAGNVPKNEWSTK